MTLRKFLSTFLCGLPLIGCATHPKPKIGAYVTRKDDTDMFFPGAVAQGVVKVPAELVYYWSNKEHWEFKEMGESFITFYDYDGHWVGAVPEQEVTSIQYK
jgi:hypothetical protein